MRRRRKPTTIEIGRLAAAQLVLRAGVDDAASKAARPSLVSRVMANSLVRGYMTGFALFPATMKRTSPQGNDILKVALDRVAHELSVAAIRNPSILKRTGERDVVERFSVEPTSRRRKTTVR
jgi:hypothetical protein